MHARVGDLVPQQDWIMILLQGIHFIDSDQLSQNGNTGMDK